LRSLLLAPSTAVEQRPARPARFAAEIVVCDSTLSLQSSTTSAFVRVVGLTGATGAVVVADLLVAATLALATASAAPTVVVTALDAEPAGEEPEPEDEDGEPAADGEPEPDDEEPQPASPPAASRAAVIQMEDMRRTWLPLL